MDASSTATMSLNSDGSKTGSSKSAASHASKEVDLTKDNTASPVDLECHIQAERITKILRETVDMVKLATCLPALVQEFFYLSSVLSDAHFGDLMYVFEQYETLFSSSTLNVEALTDIQLGNLSLRNRLNPELSHILYSLCGYKLLWEKVYKMIEEMRETKEKYVIMSTTNVSKASYMKVSHSIDFLLIFEKFRDLMVTQMETTAAEVLSIKINSRRLTASNNKLIEKIEEIRKDLKNESEAFDANMKDKALLIEKLEQELNFLKHDAVMRLKKQILDSERQMVLASRAHAVKHEMLKEEEVETTEAYDNLLRSHLVAEKNMRQRRFKVATQLLSWIQKYDLEMADKQIELDDFAAKFEEETKLVEELEAKLAEQDIEFIPLMAEREEEYHQEMTNKMTTFLLEHSARVIQNAWREVLANRAEKKRLRKLQKKMQAAAVKK